MQSSFSNPQVFTSADFAEADAIADLVETSGAAVVLGDPVQAVTVAATTATAAATAAATGATLDNSALPEVSSPKRSRADVVSF